MRTSQQEKGFTLVELVLAMTLLGILTMMVMPFFKMLMAAKEQAYTQEQSLTNQKVAKALLDYAGYNTPLGTLPAPYTGIGYTNTVYDPNDATATSLQPFLLDANLNPQYVNNDATAGKRVRVYQKITGLTFAQPLYGQSGPQATMNYEFGLVYMTKCPFNNVSPSCNPNSATGVPGKSPKLTALNYKTWTNDPEDYPPTLFSTLNLQQERLAVTSGRLTTIRDALASYSRAKMLTAAATDTTNWYPAPAANMGGQNPANNQGCRDGWYSLDNPTVNVLPQVGLPLGEMGITAWGGSIQYCRDYDPTGLSGPNTPPHYAALRAHKNVSNGSAPDSSVAGAPNNIILSF